MTIYKQVLACLFALLPLSVVAQVGEFRKDFAIGVNGGYVLSNVAFTPKVPQGMLGVLPLVSPDVIHVRSISVASVPSWLR